MEAFMPKAGSISPVVSIQCRLVTDTAAAYTALAWRRAVKTRVVRMFARGNHSPLEFPTWAAALPMHTIDSSLCT